MSPRDFCRVAREQEIDSSAVALHRGRDTVWRALHMIVAMNTRWPRGVYEGGAGAFLLGDKDTWLLGSLVSGLEPGVVRAAPGVLTAMRADGSGLRVYSGHLQFSDTGDEHETARLNSPARLNMLPLSCCIGSGDRSVGYTRRRQNETTKGEQTCVCSMSACWSAFCMCVCFCLPVSLSPCVSLSLLLSLSPLAILPHFSAGATAIPQRTVHAGHGGSSGPSTVQSWPWHDCIPSPSRPLTHLID